MKRNQMKESNVRKQIEIMKEENKEKRKRHQKMKANGSSGEINMKA